MGANKDAYSHPDRVASAAGSVMGSPMLNPFDHLPQAYQSAQHTEIMSAGASIASVNPLEVMVFVHVVDHKMSSDDHLVGDVQHCLVQ